MDASYGYGRGVLRGVLRYSRNHGPWKLFASIHSEHGALTRHRRFRLDGLIGQFPNEDLDADVAALRCPVVNVSSTRREQPFAAVWPDNARIGALAAGHLMERGFRHFAFYAEGNHGWAGPRQQGFTRELAEEGFEALTYPPALDTNGRTDRGSMPKLADWIANLPRPIGVCCGDEYQAWTFVGTAQDAGVPVPEQIAVIACGNDELVCLACDVPLSAVDIGAERVGYAAAAILDRTMAGHPAPSPDQPILIPPGRVVTRQSTDVLAVDDPRVAAAVRLINSEACKPLTVPDVLKDVPANRRWLERRFKQVLRRTIHQEIMRVRLETAKRLLIESDLPLAQIASRCGFSYQHQLGLAFRRAVGQTPATYRRTQRVGCVLR